MVLLDNVKDVISNSSPPLGKVEPNEFSQSRLRFGCTFPKGAEGGKG